MPLFVHACALQNVGARVVGEYDGDGDVGEYDGDGVVGGPVAAQHETLQRSTTRNMQRTRCSGGMGGPVVGASVALHAFGTQSWTEGGVACAAAYFEAGAVLPDAEETQNTMRV